MRVLNWLRRFWNAYPELPDFDIEKAKVAFLEINVSEAKKVKRALELATLVLKGSILHARSLDKNVWVMRDEDGVARVTVLGDAILLTRRQRLVALSNRLYPDLDFNGKTRFMELCAALPSLQDDFLPDVSFHNQYGRIYFTSVGCCAADWY